MYDQILLKKLGEYFIDAEDVLPTKLLYRDKTLTIYNGGIDMLPGDKIVQYSRENSTINIDILNEIPELVKYSGEEWLERNGFTSTRLIFLFDLEKQLKAANKMAEKLGTVILWITTILKDSVMSEEPKSDWTPCPFTFNDTAKEAIQLLNSSQ